MTTSFPGAVMVWLETASRRPQLNSSTQTQSWMCQLYVIPFRSTSLILWNHGTLFHLPTPYTVYYVYLMPETRRDSIRCPPFRSTSICLVSALRFGDRHLDLTCPFFVSVGIHCLDAILRYTAPYYRSIGDWAVSQSVTLKLTKFAQLSVFSQVYMILKHKRNCVNKYCSQ